MGGAGGKVSEPGDRPPSPGSPREQSLQGRGGARVHQKLLRAEGAGPGGTGPRWIFFGGCCYKSEDKASDSLSPHPASLPQCKLELVVGSPASCMELELYGADDTFYSKLDQEDALLGSYPVDDGCRIHVRPPYLGPRTTFIHLFIQQILCFAQCDNQ